jgi:hypothetical protein
MQMRMAEDDERFKGEDVEAIPASMIGKEAIVINDIKKTFKSREVFSIKSH